MDQVPKTWTVYLLTCNDQSLYCGVTNNLEKRLKLHDKGTASKYTRARRPVKLAASRNELTKREAFRLEYRIKHIPSSQKISALHDLEP